MSPKISVTTLCNQCVRVVTSTLIYALCDDENLNYKIVEEYLNNAPYQILQELLHCILNTQYLDASTRFSCLQMLLKSNVKILETGIFPHSYYLNILKVISNNGTGLEHLNLKGVWIHEQPELLSDMLLKLKKLKTLVMPHIADDLTLQSALQCNQLTVLDVSGECRFSSELLANIKSASIKVLDIGSYGKKVFCHPESDSCKVLARIIKNFPNLTVIQTYSFVGSAILNIYQEDPTFKTKLIYIHDTRTTIEMYNAIAKLCPSLESLYFDTPQENVLNMLSNLRNLKSLKLSKFNCNEFLCYIQESGYRLHTLRLNSCKDDHIDLSKICLYCPNLTNLDCFKINLLYQQSDHYFMSLQSLDILYCNVTDCILKCLLTNSPLLKKVVVGDVIRLTDGDIFRLCAECDFVYLEELWFSCARCLTSTTVQLLMGHCPNLRSLGQLSGWDINTTDVDYLRDFILATNTDLTLLPLGFP